MRPDSLSGKQITAWITAALIPTSVQLLGGEGWGNVLLTSLFCAAACFAVWKWGKPASSRLLLGAQFLFVIILLSQLLPNSAKSWPGDPYPAVPLVLLALATWSTWKGTGASAKVGCVLVWSVLSAYVAILAVSAGNIDGRWLSPTQITVPWQGVSLLLIPCAAVQMRGRKAGWHSGILLHGIICVLSAVAVAGTVSPLIAQNTENAFYMLTKTLRVMGTAPRFEAVLSAAATAGWFSLICLLLALGGEYMESIKGKDRRAGVVITAVAASAGMLFKMHISWWIVGVLAAVFWVVLPLITQGLVAEKKS